MSTATWRWRACSAAVRIRPSLTAGQLRADSGLLDGVQLIGTGSLAGRLWARPAIAVIGIDAPPVEAAANTLMPVARAKVSMRVAPGDDVVRARAALVRTSRRMPRGGSR